MGAAARRRGARRASLHQSTHATAQPSTRANAHAANANPILMSATTRIFRATGRRASGRCKDGSRCATDYPGPRKFSLAGDVESEVTDFAVADDVVLALEPQLAPRAQIGEGPGHRHELVVPVDLRTDEAPGDIRMHDPGRILCARALWDRPCAHLVLADREERHQPEQRIALAQHAPDGGLGKAEVREERLLLVTLKARDFRLDHRRDPADTRARPYRDVRQAEGLHDAVARGDRRLVEVDDVEDRLGGQKREAAQELV